MSTRFRYANAASGRLLRAPANGLLLILAVGTANALHAQSAGQTARQSAERQPAGTYGLLYSFQCVTDGAYPENGLVRDPSGNLYGTTNAGGGSSVISTRDGGNPDGGVVRDPMSFSAGCQRRTGRDGTGKSKPIPMPGDSTFCFAKPARRSLKAL